MYSYFMLHFDYSFPSMCCIVYNINPLYYLAVIKHLDYCLTCNMPGYFSICVCTAQIKEAVLSGVALEDDKREEFNKIEQVRL